MMNIKNSITLIAILILAVVSSAFGTSEMTSTISGPTNVYLNNTKTYTIQQSFQVLGASWSVTGGTILSSDYSIQNEGGLLFVYVVSVKWTSTGTKVLKFNNVVGNLQQLSVVVNPPPLQPGSISGSQTICYGGDPSQFTSSSTASNGTGSYSYQWQWRSPSGSWSNISGATGTTYNHGTLTSTKDYRRKVTSGSEVAYTNSVRVTVRSSLAAGTIFGAQTLCHNAVPLTLTSTASASGGNGSYTYQWQWRSPSGSWSNISGATGTTHAHGNLTSTKEFRRRVISCGQTKYSNTITITIRSVLNPGSIGGSQTVINNGDPDPFTNNASASGAGGDYVYQWQSRFILGSWADISGATSTVYDQPNLIATKEYRRRVTSASCNETAYSNVITVTVNPPLSPGSIGGTQTVCYNGDPNLLTNSASASGGIGSYTYQWEWSSSGSSWANVSSATGTSYNPGNLTANRVYRRKVTSGIEVAYSNFISISVVPNSLTSGSISGSAWICSGAPVSAFANTASATIGSGSFTYQWEKSPNGVDGWTSIPGATGATYTAAQLTINQWYRRAAISSCETKYTNVVYINIISTPVAGTISGTYQLCDSQGINLTFTAGSDDPVMIDWEKKAVAGEWTSLQNNTASLIENSQDGTQYRVAISTPCVTVYSDPIQVTIDEMGTGNVTGEGDFLNQAQGNLQVVNFGGTIDKWEQENPAGGWIDLSNNTFLQSIAGVDESTSYRVWGTNGVCPSEIIETVDVNVDHKYFEGYIAGSEVVFGLTNSVTLEVKEYQGEVTGWLSQNGFLIAEEACPVSDCNTLSITNLTMDRYYSATVVYKGVTSQTPWFYVQHQDDIPLAGTSYIVTEVLEEPAIDEVLVSIADEKQTNYTYVDGLGRTIQTVDKQASPTQQDVVGFQQYTTSNTIRSYLSHTAIGSDYYANAATDQDIFYQGYFPGQTAYAETRVEASPRARILEQGAPGNDWQLGQHTVKYNQGFNIANTVRKWNENGLSTGYYAANTVRLIETTDENDHLVRTYTDSRGLTVLKQVEETAGNYLDTYYLYDRAGRLAHVIPPKAVEVLGTSGTLDVATAGIAELIFSYTYDGRGRPVTQKVPGAVEKSIVYDQLDRVVLIQDGNMKVGNQWQFVKYDRQNRPVYSGIYTNTSQTTRATVQALLDVMDYDGTDYWYENEGSVLEGYTNQAFPTTNLEVLSVTYYDHYDFDRNATADYSYNNSHLAGQEASAHSLIRGFVTGGKTKILGTNDWLMTALFYDKDGQVVQARSNNHKNLTVADVSTAVYDFSGRVLQTKTTTNDGTLTLDIQNRYTYDHTGRITDLYQTNRADAEQLVAHYTYDELGRLENKQLHEKADLSYLQTVDYKYTIRGWLKSINDPASVTSEQLFGMKLYHNESLGALGQSAAYNGNITAMTWKEQFGNGVSNDTKAYSYTYDRMDRLTSTEYGEGTNFTLNAQRFALSAIAYDANGNIESLQRNGLNPATDVTETIDNLAYTFDGNRINNVHDTGTAHGFDQQSTGSTQEYTYDANGNMSSDANKDITSIQYNILNKPETVTFGDGTVLTYTYDAAGTKLSQVINIGGSITTQDYISGLLFENGTLQSFTHPEGRVVYNAGSFEYQYAYTDHLGNVRLMYTADSETISFTATMESETGNQVDDALFQNITNTAVDVQATSYDEVQRLLPGTISGAGISLPVYPGDNIAMQVQGFYRNGNGNSTASLSALIAAAAGTFGGLNGGTAGEQSIYDAFAGSYDPALGGAGVQQPPSGFIAAYLNYIIFDKDFKAVQQGFVPLDDDANGSAMEISIPGQVVQEEGFAYVYLTNESNAEVYFDDFEVTVTESAVIQSNGYYPFGLLHANSWTRISDLKNNFLYNAGSELNEQTKNYETFYRDYDPALGRFNQIDPLASSFTNWTPYNYAFNDPVALNDPNGDCPGCYPYWELGTQFDADPYSEGGDLYRGGHGYSLANHYEGFGRGVDWVRHDAELGSRQLASDLGVEIGRTYAPLNVTYSHDPTSDLRMFGDEEGRRFLPRGDTPDQHVIWIPGNRPDPNAGIGLSSGGESYVPIWGSGRDAIYWAQQGDYSRAAINGVMAISDIGGITALGRIGIKALLKGGAKAAARASTQSFKSFSALKKALGPAGKNKHWHHIVEQHADNVAKFGQGSIQNTKNVISIPGGFKGSLHGKVTGHYNSLMPGTSMRVRDYVKTLPYNQQYQYGIDVLKRFGWTP